MLRRVIGIVGLVFLGWCVGIISVVTCVYFDKVKPSFWQFTVIDLISLIAYSVIAIYVAYHLKNRFTDRQMKKNFFLGIANDVEKLVEGEVPNWVVFMRSDHREGLERIKVTLALRKISNKIGILEEYKKGFDGNIPGLVDKIRSDYNGIKEAITGDEFCTPKCFTEEHISKVLKKTCDIVLDVDRVKLSMFD